MAISDEFAKLQALHENGTLTDAEFADAKAKVLTEEHFPTPVQASAVEQDIQRLQIQNQILQLDQEWADERTRYMLYGRSGPAYVPTYGNTIGPASLFATLALVFFILPPSAQHQQIEETFMGFFVLLIGAVMAVGGIIKVKAYNEAYQRYQQQRVELTGQLTRA